MTSGGWVNCLRASSALGLLVFATAQANAGGFALREQSSYGQGTSFAGVAAGGALSSMFWNPATMTQLPGVVSETDVTGVFPYASHTAQPGSTLTALGFVGNGDSASDAAVPAGYFSYQLNPNLWLGLAMNAPFGLSVNFGDNFAGRNYAGSTTLRTYNTTPTIAYRINDWISIGAGVQIQYGSANLSTGLGATHGLDLIIGGGGWAYGFTAGVTLTPTPTTTIGIGYRSALDQKINGTLSTTLVQLPFTSYGSVNTTLNLPDSVSLGIRQILDPKWTVMGTVEWTNWSRIGTSNVLQPSGAPATVLNNPVNLPFQYDDGWFFSLGAEYIWDDRLTLRSGIGYEISPITDQVRTPRLPDNDRFWLSVGASWKVFKGVHFDVAYSHLWVKDPSINISATSGNPWFNGTVAYVGDVNAHVDIFSVALVWRPDELGAVPSKTLLVTK